ncbi:UBX domain-containing UAS family protein [Acetobacter pasteurianus]|nr:UBX domain-containing UAS family protein [Acetobacter pasteurianus]
MSDPVQSEAIEQFIAITGIESNGDIEEKVLRLLNVHDNNLNNAISTYFDTGFESIETASETVGGNISGSSAVDAREIENDDDMEQLIHRSSMASRNEMVNLQTQMMMNSLIPRLPKAPQISTRWQLDVGIHTSIIHEREEKEKEKEKQETQEMENFATTNSSTENKELLEQEENFENNDRGKDQEKPKSNTSLLNTIYFILLVIPKSVILVLLASIKFVFGLGFGSWPSQNPNNFRQHANFNYENFHPNYKYLETLLERTTIFNEYEIHESEFNELHTLCQREYDWLFVVLANDSKESNGFVNKLFSHLAFKRMFAKTNGHYKNTKLFLGNVDHSPEAFEIAKTYKVRKIPYVMLIANVSPSPDIMPSMSVVYKSNLAKMFIEEEEVGLTVQKVTKQLSKNCEKFYPQLIAAKYDKQEMDISRMIRQQQDDAYLQSLVQDQIKKQQREEEKKLQREAQSLQNIKTLFLLDLFNSGYLHKVSESNEVLKVAVKLPHGKRLVEQFDKSLTVLDFYIFIELKLFVENLLTEHGLESEEELIAKVDNLKNELEIIDEVKEKYSTIQDYYKDMGFKFEVVQPYPKKVIAVDADLQIGSAPEFKGANFLIEYIIEDDDEEEEGEEGEGEEAK